MLFEIANIAHTISHMKHLTQRRDNRIRNMCEKPDELLRSPKPGSPKKTMKPFTMPSRVPPWISLYRLPTLTLRIVDQPPVRLRNPSSQARSILPAFRTASYATYNVMKMSLWKQIHGELLPTLVKAVRINLISGELRVLGRGLV